MNRDEQNLPEAAIRLPDTGMNGLPEAVIEDDDDVIGMRAPQSGGRGGVPRAELTARAIMPPPAGTGAASSALAWIALGAVVVGAAGALAGWARCRSPRRVTWARSPAAAADSMTVTPPHGDKLFPDEQAY